jgi:hypothetical protein
MAVVVVVREGSGPIYVYSSAWDPHALFAFT